MNFFSLIETLNIGLKQPLPGDLAHWHMEAYVAGWLNKKPDERTRRSAVLLLLYPSGNKVFFPLIVRAAYDGVHSGQVAFPGGKSEKTDHDLIHTALREAQEEIGILIHDVKLIGTLTEVFIAPSNFLVLPVVGYLPHRPDFLPDAREVEQIIEADLHHFLDPRSKGNSEYLVSGEQVLTPHYEVEGHQIWGATAKIISELLLVLKTGEKSSII